MNKRTLLALLVCVNLLLLTAIVLVAYTPTTALAQVQATGLAGNYLLVAGEIQNEYDALYLLDQRSRTLHAFHFEKGTKRLRYSDVRDLDRDFRHNRD